MREINTRQCEYILSWARRKLTWASGILYRTYKGQLFSGECLRNLVSHTVMYFPDTYIRGHPSNFKVTRAENEWFESNLSTITRLVEAIKSLRFALLKPIKCWCDAMYYTPYTGPIPLNTLRPRQNGRHFADDIFKCIFLNETVWIPFKISLKFVPKGPINNIPALVQIMAWHHPGDKPLSEPMMVSLPTHICLTWPQWVKGGLDKTQYC